MTGRAVVMDIDEEIKLLKIKLEDARRLKTKSDVQRENARVVVDKISKKLEVDFGVNSLEEAHELLTNVDRELQEKIKGIKEKLTAFE